MKIKKIRVYNSLLIVICLFISSCNSLPDINLTNSTNLGPWLTISGDAETTIDINWLTRKGVETQLLFGTDKEDLKTIEVDMKKRRLHKISLIDLQSGIDYYYSINDQIYSFKTASVQGEDYIISVIGDLQPFKKQTKLSNNIMSQAMVNENPDLVLQLGDVSESGGLNFLQEETIRNISAYASKRPFMAAPGNHDFYTRGKENFRKLYPYDYPSEKELYHSLTYKNSTFLFLDVHPENPTVSHEQRKWFESELEKTVLLENQWIFVLVHDVILSSGSRSMNFELQRWLVPLADRFGVDAVFFGHSHNYEHWDYQYGKSGLVHNSDHIPTGETVHYFLSGGGGADLGVEKLLARNNTIIPSQWEEISGSEEFTLNAVVKSWSSSNYIDFTDNPLNGAPPYRKNYYQLPERESYSGYNNIYGYEYGEKTLHYINLEFSGDQNEVCTISVHYPDGTLLTGPDGEYPQKWVLSH